MTAGKRDDIMTVKQGGVYMKAVVYKGNGRIALEERPEPEIKDNIQDTVEIEKIIKPIYNFKAKN